MMYEKSKEYPHYSYVTFNTEGYAYGYAELVCDEVSDIDYLPTAKSDIAIGSTCLCLADGKTYILNNIREWVELLDDSSANEQNIRDTEKLRMAIEQGGVGWDGSKLIFNGEMPNNTLITIPAVVELEPDTEYTISWFDWGEFTAITTIAKDRSFVSWVYDNGAEDNLVLEYYPNDPVTGEATNVLRQRNGKEDTITGRVALIDVHEINYNLLPEQARPLDVIFTSTRSEVTCNVRFSDIATALLNGRQINAKYRALKYREPDFSRTEDFYLNMYTLRSGRTYDTFNFYGFMSESSVISIALDPNDSISVDFTELAVSQQEP